MNPFLRAITPFLAGVALLLLSTVKPAMAQPQQQSRLALLIGHAGVGSSTLAGVGNDLDVMQATLQRLGFTVSRMQDVDSKTMQQAIQSFVQRVNSRPAFGMIHYSGWSVMIKGEILVLTPEKPFNNEAELKSQSFSLIPALARVPIRQGSQLLVTFDGSLDNPFNTSPSGTRSRSLSQTINPNASVNVGRNTLLMLATAPGDVASEANVSEKSQGLFTTKLANELMRPGATAQSVLQGTASAVRRESGGRQLPYSVSTDFDESTQIASNVAAMPSSATAQSPTQALEAGKGRSASPPQ